MTSRFIFTALTTLALSTAAQATPRDFFCADYDAVGGMVKVDFTNGLVCVNGGAPTPDFCTNQWAKSLPIQRVSEGSLVVDGQTWEFLEVTAQSEFVRSELQIVRVWKHVVESGTFGTTRYDDHHADLSGSLWAPQLTADPTKAFAPGDVYCRFLTPGN